MEIYCVGCDCLFGFNWISNENVFCLVCLLCWSFGGLLYFVCEGNKNCFFYRDRIDGI